jgi:hypothetical protein
MNYICKNYTPPLDFEKAKDRAITDISAIKLALDVIFKHKKILRGSIFPYKHKCGKTQCKCANTDYRHESWYLSFSDNGTNRLKYVDSKNAPVLLPKTIEYKSFRLARQTIVETCKDLIKQINKIERIKTDSLEKALKNAEKIGDTTAT